MPKVWSVGKENLCWKCRWHTERGSCAWFAHNQLPGVPVCVEKREHYVGLAPFDECDQFTPLNEQSCDTCRYFIANKDQCSWFMHHTAQNVPSVANMTLLPSYRACGRKCPVYEKSDKQEKE